MQIRPPGSGAPGESRGTRARGTSSSGLDSTASGSPRPADTARSDEASLSREARELFQAADADVTGGSDLPPGRQREILDRIGSGFYDSPQVQRELSQRLAAALSGAEFNEPA